MSFEEIKKYFVEQGLTLGSIESFTGGLFASTITKIPGASNFFKGSVITYATEEKERLLGISHEDIEKYGVVSKQIAERMAVYGKDLLDVDVCVSFTGNAGPTAMENKKVGEIYIGVATDEKVEVFPFLLNGNREQIQQQAVEEGFKNLIKK